MRPQYESEDMGQRIWNRAHRAQIAWIDWLAVRSCSYREARNDLTQSSNKTAPRGPRSKSLLLIKCRLIILIFRNLRNALLPFFYKAADTTKCRDRRNSKYFRTTKISPHLSDFHHHTPPGQPTGQSLINYIQARPSLCLRLTCEWLFNYGSLQDQDCTLGTAVSGQVTCHQT